MTLLSTLAPTRKLLQRLAAERGLSLIIRDAMAKGSWPLLAAGERDAFSRLIAETVRSRAQDAKVVVLAQASTAGATELLADLATPLLSSPKLGLRLALALARLSRPHRSGGDAAGHHLQG